MVSQGVSSTRQGGDPALEDDLPAQIADSIEKVVGTVRDKTTGPALLIARALVYGTFIAVVSISAVVVLLIASVRILDNYLPSAVFGEDHTWAAHMLVGLALTLTGALFWRKRK